jgi:hypothetical protein
MFGKETVGKHEPRRFMRVLLVFVGIALGQFALYYPSLTAKKILLPLDLLTAPGCYLPQAPDGPGIQNVDGSVSDLVLAAEPQRRFAISELKAGRFPMWAPYHYAGAPFVWPKFSPFLLLQCATKSPVILAWSQFLVAMVAGFGAYLYLRCALGLSFWPAVLCSWCYPLTGFFVIWQGFFTVLPVCWLPWLLLTVDRTVAATSRSAPLGLAIVTGLVVVSGQLDVAGQVLLASGLYGLWRLAETAWEQWKQQSGERELSSGSRYHLGRIQKLRLAAHPRLTHAVIRLGTGWLLGLMLAGPYLLPVVEYTRTGARMVERSSGFEERPPVGLEALPQVVLPDMYGKTRAPSLRYAGGWNQLESSAAGFAGLSATLLVAPLAFCSRRHRGTNLFWVLLAFFALSWSLNIPGLVALLRLPGLNMMSHNRLVFLTCFAFLALSATGFQALFDGPFRWRSWMWLPLFLLGALCAWCVYRTIRLPDTLASEIPLKVAGGQTAAWVKDLNGVRRMQGWFIQYYATAAAWCGLGVVGWIFLRSGRLKYHALVPLLGLLLIGELLWFGYGRTQQADPALYYPPVPVLQAVAAAPPGRIMGFGCLPATLSAISGLRDIRGYDAVDPPRLVELLLRAGEPNSVSASYAKTMVLIPKVTVTPGGNIKLLPVLDMLGVRYLVFRGAPFPTVNPLFQGPDYWVWENPQALPRVFVPRRVVVITNDSVRVQKLVSPEFNPREVAYVESPVSISGTCQGAAEIVDEVPTRISVRARMETPGLVVLSDLWDRGWQAYSDGKRVPVLRANHAVRGVVVPAGSHKLEFRYESASFVWGLMSAGLSAAILLIWLSIELSRGSRFRPKLTSPSEASSPPRPNYQTP